MFYHQYPTRTCVQSNLKVGSFSNNVTLLQKDNRTVRDMKTASIKAVGVLGFDGTVNSSEPLVNVVKANKPKVLRGLNQKVRE